MNQARINEDARRPAEAFPPGEFLSDELGERGWSESDFAEKIGQPASVVRAVIEGERIVTVDLARRFAGVLGTSAEFWLNLQSAYHAFQSDNGAIPRSPARPVNQIGGHRVDTPLIHRKSTGTRG